MKKLLPFLSISIMFASCQNQSDTYTINGNTLNSTLNGEYIYLYDFDSEANTDSVMIENNSFRFAGKVTENKVARLKIKRKYSDFIIETGTINVNLEAIDSIVGTPLNDMKSEYIRNNKKWSETMNQAYDDMVAANKTDEELDAFSQSLDSLYVANNYEMLSSNNNNVLGKYIVFDILNNVNEQEEYFNILYSKLTPEAFDFAPTKKIITRIENVKKTSEGKLFTDFTVENGNADGSTAKLSDYVGNGKYILVDFWASWCGPCRKETPFVSSVYNKYKGSDFDVLSVAVWDKPENTIKAAAELGVNWNQIINAQATPTELYGIGGIPHLILFAPDGTIVARNLRGEDIEKTIAKALKK